MYHSFVPEGVVSMEEERDIRVNKGIVKGVYTIIALVLG